MVNKVDSTGVRGTAGRNGRPEAGDQFGIQSGGTLNHLELRCPPLPNTLVDALELIEQPERLEVKPVAAMVERDPIVVARLLHTVNSAYYGLQRTISTVDRAVVLLGPVAVAGIVVSMSMLRLKSVLDGPAGKVFNRLIQHSTATAFLTRHIVNRALNQDGSGPQHNVSRWGLSLTAGLLHDFGKIILVYNFPKEAVALYEDESLGAQISITDVRETERLLFGYDHTEAGEYAGRKLNFPETLVEVIGHHHEPESARGDAQLHKILLATGAANAAAKAFGYGLQHSPDWEQCIREPVWSDLARECKAPLNTPEALVEHLVEQKAFVDEYVLRMFENPAPAQATSRAEQVFRYRR